jgi:hypothetical protein
MSSWELYWILRLSALQFFFKITMIFAIVACIFFGVFIFSEWEYGGKLVNVYTRRLNKSILIVALSFLGMVLVPTTKEMFALKFIPAIINNEDVQEIPKLGIKYVTEWLEEQIKEAE